VLFGARGLLLFIGINRTLQSPKLKRRCPNVNGKLRKIYQMVKGKVAPWLGLGKVTQNSKWGGHLCTEEMDLF
jgi:hypothetical protein